MRTHPFRTALAAALVAATMFGIAAATDKGEGHGWTDGTQPIANIAWISMLLLIAAAAVFAIAGVLGLARRSRHDDAHAGR
jgi:hypothetical protein